MRIRRYAAAAKEASGDGIVLCWGTNDITQANQMGVRPPNAQTANKRDIRRLPAMVVIPAQISVREERNPRHVSGCGGTPHIQSIIVSSVTKEKITPAIK